jgi:hypothetical protein
MPRFVILLHETPPDSDRATHWDLMLEVGDVLRTWAIGEEPRMGRFIDAEGLADHRLAYLDYEGPVSRDRGTVSRWDSGHYSVEQETATQMELRLHGTRLQCRASLTRGQDAPEKWCLKLTP